MNLLPTTATPLRAIEALTISAQNETRKPCTDEGHSLGIRHGARNREFEMRRSCILLSCLASILVERAIFAQTSHENSSAACESSNQVAVRYANEGHSQEAESLLVEDLSELERTRSGAECMGLVLNNLAAIMLASGRLAKAELFAERSINILEKSYSRKDRILLRPLQVL